jgi:anaerobic ribonucleoside-triphosphate reductase activating protein
MSDLPIQVAGTVGDSITDGPGLRFTLFVQGCPRRCPGCHNPTALEFHGGIPMAWEDLLAQIQRNPLLRGVTLSGGEPFCQAEALLPLCRALREKGYELAAYTGYTLEELLTEGSPAQRELLSLVEVLVDGPFIQERRNLALPFRGSENQRILNVPASLKANQAVWETSPRWGGGPQP